MSLLQIQDLEVHYPGVNPDLPVRAVDGLSLELTAGETYALVGESGCGKSATGFAVLNLLDPGYIAGGRILFDGKDLVQLTDAQMRKVRGGQIGLAFQEASSALNPVMRVGKQIAEVVRLHLQLSRAEADREAIRLLETVALDDPEAQARAYPHELSGGMRQRAMLAIALAGRPKLLIADEPTTALDVTIQAQILALIRRLKQEMNLTILLITHDLGVVAENADRVGVMYAGRLVEESPVVPLFDQPLHPYTQGLLAAMPARAIGHGRLTTLPGGVPDPAKPPPGCRFHPRCAQVFDPCASRQPGWSTGGVDRRVRCFLHEPGDGADAGNS